MTDVSCFHDCKWSSLDSSHQAGPSGSWSLVNPGCASASAIGSWCSLVLLRLCLSERLVGLASSRSHPAWRRRRRVNSTQRAEDHVRRPSRGPSLSEPRRCRSSLPIRILSLCCFRASDTNHSNKDVVAAMIVSNSESSATCWQATASTSHL